MSKQSSEEELRRQISLLVHKVKSGRSIGSTRTVKEIMRLVAQEKDTLIDEVFTKFFDVFEKEIDQQEFAIDEAEWMSLIQAMRVAQQTAQTLLQYKQRGVSHELATFSK